MRKINVIIALLIVLNSKEIIPQSNSPLDFWPHHVGDVWQYRSQITGNIIGTQYLDSIDIDKISGDFFLYYRPIGSGTKYRIDSSGNLYNVNFNPDYIRYKLYADSGDTWIAGYTTGSVNDSVPVTVKVTEVYPATFFGISTIIKTFRFEIQNPPPVGPFWIGTDYLAKDFGLIRTDVEPSDVYYLSGALIDGVQYGIITSVETNNQIPGQFEIIVNYPNPFNNSTKIFYTILREGEVNITIYDLLGREVRTLVNEKKQKGSYEIGFEANDITSGVYFLVLKTETNILTHKILLLK